MIKKLKLKIINILLKNLFNAVTENDILKIVGNKVRIGGVFYQQKQLEEIASEARVIINLELWKQLVKDCKYEANKTMYKNSTHIDDLFAGKMMLHTINVIEIRLARIAKIKQDINRTLKIQLNARRYWAFQAWCLIIFQRLLLDIRQSGSIPLFLIIKRQNTPPIQESILKK